MRCRHLLLALFAAPLLTACINDAATYEIDNTREHVISVIREQPYPWDQRVNVSVIVSRMPACMRRHNAGAAQPGSKVELYQVPSGAFIVKIGKRMFATETQTCESFAKITEEPAEMGQLMGTFREKDGQFIFERSPDNPAPAANPQ